MFKKPTIPGIYNMAMSQVEMKLTEFSQLNVAYTKDKVSYIKPLFSERKKKKLNFAVFPKHSHDSLSPIMTSGVPPVFISGVH